MKEMTCKSKVHSKKELLHRIMAAAAYIHPEMFEPSVNSCFKRARLSIEGRGGQSERL
jgi:hypothetical protein